MERSSELQLTHPLESAGGWPAERSCEEVAVAADSANGEVDLPGSLQKGQRRGGRRWWLQRT